MITLHYLESPDNDKENNYLSTLDGEVEETDEYGDVEDASLGSKSSNFIQKCYVYCFNIDDGS